MRFERQSLVISELNDGLTVTARSSCSLQSAVSGGQKLEFFDCVCQKLHFVDCVDPQELDSEAYRVKIAEAQATAENLRADNHFEDAAKMDELALKFEEAMHAPHVAEEAMHAPGVADVAPHVADEPLPLCEEATRAENVIDMANTCGGQT